MPLHKGRYAAGHAAYMKVPDPIPGRSNTIIASDAASDDDFASSLAGALNEAGGGGKWCKLHWKGVF